MKLIPGEAPVHTMNKRIYAYTRQEKARESEYGEFKIIKGKYAYFRFRSFASCGGQKYNEFLNKSFKRIKDQKIDQLVIDLRGNTGGVMQYEFMSYIVGENIKLGKYVVAKPSFDSRNKYVKKTAVDYLRHRRMSKSQRRQVRKGKFNNGEIYTKKVDSNLVYHGRIVVITDESTFSSAGILACHLKTLANAKILGRTAGGSFYKGNSGTLHVKLPESGFELLVNPNTFYSHLSPSVDPRAIKEPDVFLNPVFMDARKLESYYFREACELFSKN